MHTAQLGCARTLKEEPKAVATYRVHTSQTSGLVGPDMQVPVLRRTGPSAVEAGTTRLVVKQLRARDPLPMTKRVVAAFLWFYTGWYAGAFLAEMLGVSPVIGPILGAAAAVLLVGDPLRIIWTRPAPKAVSRVRHGGDSARIGLTLPAPRSRAECPATFGSPGCGTRRSRALVHELQGEGAEVDRAVDINGAAPERESLRDEVGLEIGGHRLVGAAVAHHVKSRPALENAILVDDRDRDVARRTPRYRPLRTGQSVRRYCAGRCSGRGRGSPSSAVSPPMMLRTVFVLSFVSPESSVHDMIPASAGASPLWPSPAKRERMTRVRVQRQRRPSSVSKARR